MSEILKSFQMLKTTGNIPICAGFRKLLSEKISSLSRLLEELLLPEPEKRKGEKSTEPSETHVSVSCCLDVHLMCLW